MRRPKLMDGGFSTRAEAVMVPLPLLPFRKWDASRSCPLDWLLALAGAALAWLLGPGLPD